MKINYRVKIHERSRAMYLSGLRQGTNDAKTNHKPRYKQLWHSDTNLLNGYADGYEGWKIAIRNELRKGK